VILNAGLASGSDSRDVNGCEGNLTQVMCNQRCTGPGGGVVAGVIWTSERISPAAIAPQPLGGNNGVIAAGKPACTGFFKFRTAGSNGLTQTNYTAPMGNCSCLYSFTNILHLNISKKIN